MCTSGLLALLFDIEASALSENDAFFDIDTYNGMDSSVLMCELFDVGVHYVGHIEVGALWNTDHSCTYNL